MTKERFIKKMGENIRKLRQARGLSSQALAEQMELTAKHLQAMERGERAVTPWNLYRLSRVLDVTADRFFYNSPE